MTNTTKTSSRRRSDSQRLAWKVTFRIPTVVSRASHKEIALEDPTFTYEALGYDPSVACQRAYKLLRKEPNIKGTSIRQLTVMIEYVGKSPLRPDAGIPPKDLLSEEELVTPPDSD